MLQLSITWLHPLGSLDDQLFQIEDSEAQMLSMMPMRSAIAAGDLRPGLPAEERLHARPRQLRASICLLRSNAAARAPRCLRPRRYAHAELNPAPGQIQGALRTHREYGGFASAILSDSRFPDTRAISRSPDHHVAGTKCCRR